MRNFATFFSAVVLLIVPVLSNAGVVIDEREVVNLSHMITRDRTIMIEGNRQKSLSDNGKRTTIIDLDKGTMTVVDQTRKSYVVAPLPPKDSSKSLMPSGVPPIRLEKTGGHGLISGYSCDEYTGSGFVGQNTVLIAGCFSESAPGAADYDKFQSIMADKIKGSGMANPARFPAGVPLTLSTTTTFGRLPAKMSPEQAARIERILPRYQFVTSTTVTNITLTDLPMASFQVPPDYHRQQLPKLSGAASGKGPVHRPTIPKAPN
ncbi:MAG: hypothetical protein JO189_02085 [Deltaproteobacteria bacterium]|nr:hypothetical protein [Deltaproteobacteria bacterium]